MCRIGWACLLMAVAMSLHAGCGNQGVWLQVLGSGGPEVFDQRASSGYLVWVDGKARVLVDAGGGVGLRFGQSGARVADLDAVLLSHLHVDHSADLPVLIKSSYFEQRQRPLPLWGPEGNRLMPSLKEFTRALFGSEVGAYRYLSDHFSPTSTDSYRIEVHTLPLGEKTIGAGFRSERMRLAAVPVHHGPIPALAWRVDMANRSIAFSGDMDGSHGTLEKLAEGVDLLVAHHAIPETETGAGRSLHMPPSVIGRIAAAAKVKQLVLSHRMTRTLGREQESLAIIRRHYQGPVRFAEDLDCFKP